MVSALPLTQPPARPHRPGRWLPAWLSAGWFVFLLVLSPAPSIAATSSPTPAQLEFFEQRIRPLLANECYECHGAKKQKGGLRLDSRDALRAGGDSGATFVPGDARHSLLIQSITHQHADLKMPKDRPQLPASAQTDLARWVNDGAPDPRDHPPGLEETPAGAWDTVFRARREWWSFQPVQNPPVPTVTHATGSAHPVDRFILAKLETTGLALAAPAARSDLLRRVHFVLTGLPPTPDDVTAFLQDSAPDAFAKVVDRLLDSPRFGEHWARHWMDLVRFAETHGSEGDPDIPNAWRYRDYLIRAFNADVPLDQLIREHVAGDLLPHPRRNETDGINESLLGLTHLRLVEHGFQSVDTLDEQVKTVDSQIDVIAKAFQGLTISCARCHDHKFDPISQRDYYALYGVLASSRPTHLTADLPERLRKNRDELERLKLKLRQDLGTVWSQAIAPLVANLRAVKTVDGVDQLAIPGDEFTQRLADLERQMAAVDAAGRAAALRARGVVTDVGPAPAPRTVWTFEDSPTNTPGEFLGGAAIRNGRLVLDGKGAYFRSPPLAQELREKTLEAWVAPANLDQRGGGVITVESADGSVFDSVVFAERESKKWLAGSEGHVRSANLNGPAESAPPGEWVHLAITYRSDRSIAVFRNGEPYGAPYTPAGGQAALRTYAANSTRVLLGMRHTGGGTPFFAGEIEEARLYDRALSAAEVQASFRSGPGIVSAAEIAAALTPDQRAEREQLQHRMANERAALAAQLPDFARRDAARTRWLTAFTAAKKLPGHPVSFWDQWRGKSAADLATEWPQKRQQQTADTHTRRENRTKSYREFWDVAREERPGDNPTNRWFRYGANPPETVARPGEFSVLPEGNRILDGLLPAGVFSHRLSEKHNGIFASPPFKVTTDRISVRVVGAQGARVRLISDNYPIGNGNIFPNSGLNGSAANWVTLDTAYRKGSISYLEFATAEDVTSRERPGSGPGGRSYFGVTEVLFHDAKEGPKDALDALSYLLPNDAPVPASSDALAQRFETCLTDAVDAWRRDALTESQRLFLDPWLRSGLLPTTLADAPELTPDVAAYRQLEAEIPVPRRIPGVVEAVPVNAPLLSRGDHLRPTDPVPRGYLQLVEQRPFATPTSGRAELAAALTRADNPLTSRVLVNRVWHHLFGRGIVPTVDNFGRLGERPSHPELLDYLASHLVAHGWSSRELIRFLVTSQTWQAASDASPAAREKDPANVLLSHARVRRLEAESIRDSLLAVSGRLDLAQFGPGADALAPAAAQRRRSVYLTVRRNFLSPFLEAFDAPKPFSTLGRRDTTNVPGQSLALLNDPFVIEQAMQLAAHVLQSETGAAARMQRMFALVLGRHPQAAEQTAGHAYLADLATAHGPDHETQVWRDFGQSLFNLKEFIFLR